MKKVTVLSLCFFVLPFVLFSQLKDLRLLDEPLNVPIFNKHISYPTGIVDQAKSYNDETSVTFTPLTRVVGAQWSLFGFLTPFVYEPISNTLVLSIANYSLPQNQTDLLGTITLFYSTNYGQSWQNRGVFSKSGEVPVLASVGVVNPENSTNPSRLSYFVFAPFARKNVQGDYPWAGGMYVISTPESTESSDFLYPGNLAGYRWWTSRVAAHSTSDGSFAYNVGMLVNSETTQYGQYGFASFSFGDFDFLFQGCPPSWSLSRFRTSDKLNSTFNSNMLLDVDNQGTVYAAVCNFFQPNVTKGSDRVPGISKSTDYGQTWSEFQPAPSSVFIDYVSTWGGTANDQMALILPYQPDAFVVLGPDEYSFFTRVIIPDNSGNLHELHIVEANYSGGLWTVNKVANIFGFPYIIDDVSTQQNVLKDSLYGSFLGNELQAAKTKDGRYIILKWVDFINKSILIDPPIVIANGAQKLDTLFTTDVFFAYREKNIFQWSEPINATNDTVYDKITWIPNIIPSIDKVPLVKSVTLPIQYQDPNHPRNSYPAFVQQLVVDYPQEVRFASVSLIGISKVEEQVNPNFYLKDPQPNPANGDFTEIGFVLNKQMNIKLELFDIMGNSIKTLYEGPASSGIHAVMVNTSELASGSYFYKFSTSDGNSVTKLLNIVR